jgi:ABC-type antimicrobial peptide transport system permease subunit
VVDDVRYRGLGAPPEGTLYLPYTQRTFDVMHLIVRPRAGDSGIAADVRRLVGRADPHQAVADGRSMAALIADASSAPRLRLRIVGALTALALLLAALGLHGVVAETVESRRREFAVRLALGASPRDVRLHVLAHGMRLLGLGLALGALPTYAVSRALPAALSGTSTANPSAFALAVLLIAGVGLAATWWPAARAARRSPAPLLHGDTGRP